MLIKPNLHGQHFRGTNVWRCLFLIVPFAVAIINLFGDTWRTPPSSHGLALDKTDAKRPCDTLLAQIDDDQGLSGIESLLNYACTIQDLGNAFYRRQRHLDAAYLFERALKRNESYMSTSHHATIYRRLSTCYERLNLTESADFYARKTLESGGLIGPALDLARRFEKAGDRTRAANYISMACAAYSASRRLPFDQLSELQASDRRLLWASTFSTGYLRELRALDALVNDPKVSEETRAQVHWEMVTRAQPLLACGEELFRRQGAYADGRDYYYATPSILPDPQRPDEDHLILTRLLNYRIDRDGRYYKDFLPVNDTSGVLRSTCVLYVGRQAGPGEMVRIADGHFERAPYKFLGTEDPRLFLTGSGDIRVFWTSWEFSKHLGEGSRIVSGILDVNASTVRVDHLFQSPYNRFLEKNWVVFEVPGSPLRIVYEWYPLRVGTFNQSQQIGKLELDSTVKTPLAFKHIRGSSNGCYHNHELWFLVHGTTWHKGPGPVYYHRIAVLDPLTLHVKRYTHPFKLESHDVPVEFSLGMTIDAQDRLTVAYSVFDGSSVLRRISMWKVEELMIREGTD